MKSYKRGYEVTPLSYNRGVTTHNHILVYRTKSVFLFVGQKRVQADKTSTNQKTI